MPFLFTFSENGFSLFSSGLTDAFFVLPLQPGSSYSLVALGIDHVGNKLGTPSLDNIMDITTSLQEIGKVVKKRENNSNIMTRTVKKQI